MSSPRREVHPMAVEEGESGVEMAPRTNTVAKLKRLASNPDYQKEVKKESFEDEDESIDMSPAGAAASRIGDILKKPSTSHADIRRFIEKEYTKSSASRELLRHLIFLVILIAGVTLHRSVYESYLLNQALMTSFITQQIDSSLQPFPKTYQDVGQPDEFVDWFISVLGGTLDQSTFYNGQNMTDEEQNYVMFSNRLVGGVRLRQLRAAPNKGCHIPHQLRELSRGVCYSYDYSSSTRDTKPFGPPQDPTRYKYQTPEETGSVGIFGYILDYLDGGGYVVDANIEDKLNGSTYTDTFQQLIDDMWIDRQTRAVIISMVFVNLELESRVGVLYLIVEIPGDGLFFSNYMIKTFRLDLYVTPLDYFRLFLEVLFFLMILYSIFTEGNEMVNNYRTRHTGKGLKKYFYNGWNIIELVDITLYIVVIVLYIKYLAAPERYNAKLDTLAYSSDMERLAAIALGFYNVLAFNVILTTFRTFKYLKLNHRLYLLWKTLRHAGMDLIGFLFIFLIFIFGFIFMGWLSFGSDLADFNTFVHSFATCWNFIIGNAPDYNAMNASNRVLGPAFFVLFTIFIFFILANMFIAILSNSFEVVSGDNEDSKLKDVFEEKLAELSSAFKKIYNLITKRDQRKRPITEILDNLAHPDILDRSNLTRDDIAKAIGEGASEIEIDNLHQWVKKLESRRQTRKPKGAGTLNRNSQSAVMDDFQPREEDEEATKSLMKSSIGLSSPPFSASTPLPPSSPFPSSSSSTPVVDEDTKTALREMKTQMIELKQLIHRLTRNKDDTD